MRWRVNRLAHVLPGLPEMSVGGFVWVIGAFVLALGLLIVVHELGHYCAARLCGVKILRFSVGFGHPLWMRRFGADKTEWAVAAFPLGGYVKMLDEREDPVAEHELARAFNRQSIARRSFIVLAGPLANLLLAILLYWFLFLTGVEEPRPILAAPKAGSLAAEAKVDADGTVRKVSGTPVASWIDMRWQVLQRVVDKAPLELETELADGTLAIYRIDTARLDNSVLDADVLDVIGLRLKRPELPAVLGEVQPGSPADRAGLKVGDRVLSLGGRSLSGWHELAKDIREGGVRELSLELDRGGERLRATVLPEWVSDRDGRQVARIGIGVRDDPDLRTRTMLTVRYGAVDAFGRAMTQTWETAVMTLRMMGRMLLGEISVKNISGPVTIADYAGQSARMGSDHYLRFIALISISLGVLNLLPIPVLDGGHLLYYLAEAIKGGSLSERVMEIGQQIGLALLGLLMAVAFYNDINRLISG